MTGATSVFLPEQSRSLLEDAGVTDLTLTIAGDPAVPLTAQIAEAIASDLRANIGAQVTVVEQSAGSADYIVRPATQPPPPSDLPFEFTCTPDTYRPGVWVPVECAFRIANTGSSGVDNIYLMIGAFFGDVVPEVFQMSTSLDGQPIPADDLVFDVEGMLQPGQAADIRANLLMRIDEEGAGQSEWQLNAGSQTVAAGALPYEAKANAAEPPKDLDVSRKILENGDGKLIYRTTVTNQGSSAVTDLQLTERYNGESLFLSSAPGPSSEQADVQIATWDLPALGKEFLSPGESVEVRTEYSSGYSGDACAWVDTGVMVEASINGATQRYGARAEDNPVRIEPCLAAETGGGGGATSLVDGGEGSAAAEGDVLWAAAVLAGGGVALVAAAMALLRRSRRRERGV
ncbi:MAG: hypothetical protein A2Y61_02305 [Chloroflexi bacterium RBG_13_60_13]|nr:MAG: hypothetical protein A2Y61_02305 [Chloroflexi bacterium RBG_13_60_13]